MLTKVLDGDEDEEGGVSQQQQQQQQQRRQKLPIPAFSSSSQLSLHHPHANGYSSSVRSLQDTTTTSTTDCTLECCTGLESELCGDAEGEEEDPNSSWIDVLPLWVQILFVVFLLCFSALVSGLTLGLLALDVTGLEIVMAGDDPRLAQYARNIYPIRKQGNWLLCTLVLANVAVNSFLSILMAEFTGGVVGFVTSTVLIVIFGEILPQAAVRDFFRHERK
jgi:Cyclin M transmembrane N-terminal domain